MPDKARDAESYLFADRVFPVMRIVLLAVVTLTQAVLGGPPLFAHQDVPSIRAVNPAHRTPKTSISTTSGTAPPRA